MGCAATGHDRDLTGRRRAAEEVVSPEALDEGSDRPYAPRVTEEGSASRRLDAEAYVWHGSAPPECPYCGSRSSQLEKARNGDIAWVEAARWLCAWCGNRWWEIRQVAASH